MNVYAYLAQLLVAIVFSFGLYLMFVAEKERPTLRSVAVLVLGDIGRSPRMMYHAESFAKNGLETLLIGYEGSAPIPSLLTSPHVRTLGLRETPHLFRKLPFLLLAPIKIFIQITTILYTLFVRISHPPEYIMVQNPPSIPTLALVQLVCALRGSKLIIDWHNLGYSVLALRLGKEHLLVRMAEKLERRFGRQAAVHLFVTNALRDYLVKTWDLQGAKVVLHDRPPENFHRASAFEAHELFLRLTPSLSLSPALSSFLPSASPPRSTPFTSLTTQKELQYEYTGPFETRSSDELPAFREDRPALLVSSTSWTPDEDFDMLFDALRRYEQRAQWVNDASRKSDSSKPVQRLPKVLLIVTGKGPMRDAQMAKIVCLETDEKWEWVRVRSVWLEANDYPLLLGSADLGICMHSSSSALDLPMKIVDMFGCGLPVCALNFDCLGELVKPDVNGLVFRTSEELSTQLESLLLDFPHAKRLALLREVFERKSSPSRGGSPYNGLEWEWCSWAENWDTTLRPYIMYNGDRDHSNHHL